MNPFWIGGLILLVILVTVMFIVTLRVVPEEERRVVYRLGRFHRITGPGLVMIIPGLEHVGRTFEVRTHPIEIAVSGLLAFGVPNDLSLNLWCRFDPVQAAGGDHHKLAELAQMRDTERHHQVEVKMREALINQIARLEERQPLPQTAILIDKVMALAPGSSRYHKLIEGLKEELARTLPAVGFILDPNQSIVLTGRNLSEEIIEAIKRRREREIDSEWLTNYVDRLRQRFPDLSGAMLSQMLASIEGVDVGKIQRLFFEQDKDVAADLEFEVAADSEGPDIVTKPKLRKRETTIQPQTVQPKTDHTPPPRTTSPLTPDDLAVLKSVPRSRPEQRLSA